MPIEPFSYRTRRFDCLEGGEEKLANQGSCQIDFVIMSFAGLRRQTLLWHEVLLARLEGLLARAPLAAGPFHPVDETQAHWHGETGDLDRVLSVALFHRA